MDLATARALTSADGERALAAAARFSDPSSLAAGTQLRRQFPADLAAAALEQIVLRRRVRTRVGDQADQMLWTPESAEQATRREVAHWRAARLAAAGVRQVIDLTVGAGADARAFLDAGLGVLAVERDPATALLAAHNLPGVRVLTGDAALLAPQLLVGADPRTCVFLDPARRTSRGRSWRLADISPPWDFVLDQLAGAHFACVKLAPGVPLEELPAQVDASWVSVRRELVECCLWHAPGQSTGRRSAVLLGADLPEGQLQVDARPTPSPIPVAAPGRWLYEPDPALIRADALDVLADQGGLWRLSASVAYLSGDKHLDTPLAGVFEVLEVLDYKLPVLRAWVRSQRVGILEIKKRAIDVDPAWLRRQLRPAGPHQATLVLSPTVDGARVLVVRRVP